MTLENSLFPHLGWKAGLLLVVVTLAGCGGKAPSPKATAQQLENSFAKADAAVKQEVAQASTALQSGNFAQAIIVMNQLPRQQPLDEAQRQAMSRLIQQTRQAVNQNPKLNSPELYKAMSEMILRVHGEN